MANPGLKLLVTSRDWYSKKYYHHMSLVRAGKLNDAIKALHTEKEKKSILIVFIRVICVK